MAMQWEYKKGKMVGDIIYICSLNEDTLSKEAKRAVLKDFTWRYAEMRDVENLNNNVAAEDENPNKKTKKLGNKYWSKEALEQYDRNNGNVKGLCFDHIVPKRIFIELCINYSQQIKQCSKEKLKEYLDKILVGCVITEQEHTNLENKDNKLRQKMPEDVREYDLEELCKARWSRYEKVGIEPIEIVWKHNKTGKCKWEIGGKKPID